jgi:hypothetical protein
MLWCLAMFPYGVVLVFVVCCFHVPHFFRHFGLDLGEVFWVVYMFEAALELPLVRVVHV